MNGGSETFASLGDPALNNRGQVAFIVEPQFGQQILVTGPDFVDDRVIGTGDKLAGRSITNVVFAREGLNDAGQLGFTAFFKDGSSGVFVATPRLSRQPDLHISSGNSAPPPTFPRPTLFGCRTTALTQQTSRSQAPPAAHNLPCAISTLRTAMTSRHR